MICAPWLLVLCTQSNLCAQGPNRPRFGHDLDPKALAFEVRLIGPQPLPYQPLRVRPIVRNIGNEGIAHLLPIEYAVFFEPSVVARNGKRYEESVWPARLIDLGDEKPEGYWTPGPLAYVEPGPKEQVSASFAVTPYTLEFGLSNQDLENYKLWGPGQYKLQVKYRAGWDRLGQDVELRAELPLVVVEPQGPDKQVADILADDPKLARCLSEALAPPAPEQVAKLKDLLKLYPKKRELSGLASVNGTPRFVEREVCAESSYAYYIHFALARHYMNRRKEEAYTAEGNRRAAEELDHVVDKAFAYQPNALILALRKTTLPPFSPHIAPSVWTPARYEQMRKLLIDHYSDTAEFLSNSSLVFYNENLEWMPHLPRGSPENWYKFRKTIPKPYPPPALVQASPNEPEVPPNERPRAWRNAIVFTGLSTGILAFFVLAYFAAMRLRRPG